MTSIKERIAALQNAQRGNTVSESTSNSKDDIKTVNKANFQSIQERIAAAQQNMAKTSLNEEEEQGSERPLVHPMKGLNMNAMLAGGSLKLKKPSGVQCAKNDEEDQMKEDTEQSSNSNGPTFKRAVIAKGTEDASIIKWTEIVYRIENRM